MKHSVTFADPLTAAQANWNDGSGNHSVGQLAYHLVFWNQQELAKFKGETPAKYSGKNDDTFNNFDSRQWATVVQQFDQVRTDWERRSRPQTTRRSPPRRPTS